MTENPTQTDRAKLAAKLARVILGTGWIPKDGKNEYSNYHYATAADTFACVRKPMAEAGLALLPSVKSVTCEQKKAQFGEKTEYSKNWITRIVMAITIIDTETGYSETTEWHGEAQDTGDKGLYKAYTNTLKYWAHQTFVFPTGEDVETGSPEKDDEPRKPAGKGKGFYGDKEPSMTAPGRPQTPEEIGDTLLNFPEEKAKADQAEEIEVPADLFGKTDAETQNRVYKFLVKHYKMFDTDAEKLDVNRLRAVLRLNYAEDMKSAKGVQRILKGISHKDVSGEAA